MERISRRLNVIRRRLATCSVGELAIATCSVITATVAITAVTLHYIPAEVGLSLLALSVGLLAPSPVQNVYEQS